MGTSSHPPSGLPHGWRALRLGEIARVYPGGRLGLTKTDDYVESGVPAFSAAGQDGNVAVEEFQEPGVVLSSIGARCGKTFLAGSSWTTLANTQAIIPDPNQADHRYIWQVTNDESFWVRSGTAQPFIKPRDVKGAWLALPPLPEQRKIAAILSSVDEAIEKTQAVIDQVQVVKKGLMQELLTKGLPGRHQKFKQTEIGTIPESWDVVPLVSLLDGGSIANGIYRPQESYGRGNQIIRIDAFDHGDSMTPRDLRRLEVENADLLRYGVQSGDILINRVNSLSHIGKCAFIVAVHEPTVFESNMMRVRLGPSCVLPEFAFLWIAGPFARSRWLERAKRAVAQASINQDDVGGLPIPIPTIAEQAEIISLGSALSARLSSEFDNLDQLRTLKSALMQSLLTGQIRVTP